MAYNIPTYDINVRPKYYNDDDGAASGYREVWLKHNSPSTSNAIAGASTPDGRLLLAPWSVVSGIKSAVWYLAWDVWIDPAWDPQLQGAWGTGAGVNAHNSPQDEEGIGWSDASWSNGGVSSYYNSYIGGNMGIQLENSSYPNKRFTYFPNVPKGQWHSILVELTFGRTDLSSYKGFAVPNGRVRLWLNGSDTPVDTGPTNTLIWNTNPATGNKILQGVMVTWDGFYTKNCTQVCHLQMTAVRVGRTVGECMNDVPVKVAETVSNILDPNGVGPNLGPSSYSVITPRTSADFRLPPSLGGTGTPPPEEPPPSPTSHYGRWTSALQWNAATLVDPPDTPPSVVEQHIGRWSTTAGWNAMNDSPPPVVTPTSPGSRRRSLRRRYWRLY